MEAETGSGLGYWLPNQDRQHSQNSTRTAWNAEADISPVDVRRRAFLHSLKARNLEDGRRFTRLVRSSTEPSISFPFHRH